MVAYRVRVTFSKNKIVIFGQFLQLNFERMFLILRSN